MNEASGNITEYNAEADSVNMDGRCFGGDMKSALKGITLIFDSANGASDSIGRKALERSVYGIAVDGDSNRGFYCIAAKKTIAFMYWTARRARKFAFQFTTGLPSAKNCQAGHGTSKKSRPQ